MHTLKIISIILLVIGILIFSGGLIFYWTTNPTSSLASILVMVGILFLLGSIILLCVSLQYDMSPPDLSKYNV